jgi:hypothetical protein
MKSFTIHDLDTESAGRLLALAESQGLSLNQAAKQLMRDGLGLGRDAAGRRRKEFLDLFGTWSAKDARDFEAAVAGLSRVDPRDWERA